jgi:hypothetical protein
MSSSIGASYYFSNRYAILAAKILLVVIILLWLPPLVSSKTRKNSARTSRRRIHRTRLECEMDCMEYLPEESMNCILSCMSINCYNHIYATNTLEPGEVDVRRFDAFENCVEEELKQERRQRAAAARKK